MMIPFFITLSSSAILGIDLGDYKITYSIMHGSRPLHIATNSQGKHEEPHFFAFWNRTRQLNFSSTQKWNLEQADSFDWAFGSAGHDQCLRLPNNCLAGNIFGNKNYFNLSSVEIVALSLIKSVSSILTTERIPLNERIQAVVSIPPGISPQNKSLLYAACSLAGLEVTQFIDTTTAPAQLYALERSHKFRNSTRVVAFADIGSSGSRVSIFKFSNNQLTNETEVSQLSSAFENHIGGKLIDEKLAQHLAKRYNVSLSSQRQRAEFIEDIRQVKEMLTIHPSVDLKFDDEDSDDPKIITATRNDLLAISGEVNMTILGLVRDAMNQAKINKIDSLELVGGSTRIQFIQEILKHAFKVQKASRSLDGDHAVAMGAGYIAAELSQEYKVTAVKRSTLLTSFSSFCFGREKFRVFTPGDYDDVTSELIINASPGQVFIIKGADDNDYMRFTISNLSKPTELNLSLIHNFFLMPVPYQIVDQDGQLHDYEMHLAGWEIPKEKLLEMNDKVKYLISIVNKRRKLEKASNDLEELAYQINHFIDEKTFNSECNTDCKNMLDELTKYSETALQMVENGATQEQFDNYFVKIHDAFKKIKESDQFATDTAKQKLQKSLIKASQLIEDGKGLGFSDDADFHELKLISLQIKQWISVNSERKISPIDFNEKRANLKQVMNKVIKKLYEIKKVNSQKQYVSDNLIE